jgi:DNA-binding HxlR family transcriptional regulator
MDDVRTLAPYNSSATHAEIPCFSPAVETLTKELLGQIADKWTMIVLEELVTADSVRFSALRRAIPEISQKMLTQTLRRMERNGLVTRTVHPVIPPNVEYSRTELGHSLGKAVCGIWSWVETHAETMDKAQKNFDSKR